MPRAFQKGAETESEPETDRQTGRSAEIQTYSDTASHAFASRCVYWVLPNLQLSPLCHPCRVQRSAPPRRSKQDVASPRVLPNVQLSPLSCASGGSVVCSPTQIQTRPRIPWVLPDLQVSPFSCGHGASSGVPHSEIQIRPCISQGSATRATVATFPRP